MASIERTAYPRFRREPSAAELQEFFTPREEEIEFVYSFARSDQTLFGAMVLLKAVQYLGHFPRLPEIPQPIVQHIRISLRLSAELILGYENDRTLRRYQTSILQYLGLKPSHGREARKAAIAAAAEASQTMTNTADLINTVVERMRAERCELPSFETLNRLVHRVRRVVHQRIFGQVLERLAQTDTQRLDDLLKTTEIVQRQSAFQDLKESPKKPSLTHLEHLLDHLEWLEGLDIAKEALREVPAPLIRHFATEAKALHVNELRVVEVAKRYTLLLCLLHRMQLRARDDVAEMFVKRMMKIHGQARERLLQIQARQRETAEHLISTLASMLEVVGAEGSADEKIRHIEQVVTEKGGLDGLREGCEAVQSWSHNNYFPLLARPYQRHRHVLFRLVRTLRLVSTSQDESLLTALQYVVAHQDRRGEWIPAEDLDLAFASEKWKELMFRTRDGEREMHRRHLEICVFSQVALDLKATDLAVVGSEQYADYREHLLPWEECLPLLEGYCDKVGLPKTAKEFVQRLRSELEAAAQEADDNYPKNTTLAINERGEPVLKKTPAREVPASAMELEAALQERMPERSLIDILWLSNRVLHYTRHFGPLSGLEPKLEDPWLSYCLTLFTMASGLGVAQAARHMRGLITESTLSRLNRRHITAEKLEAAQTDLLNEYSRFELPRVWGTGKTAAFDGTLMELAEQNLLANFHFRYRLKGAVAFHVVSDLYIAIFSHFIPPGVWEAVYIIEALLKNKSKIQPDTVFADTQGQSTPVFAFTYLLGINLMPRIRNWKDLCFFRPSKTVRYRHIDSLFKDTIEWPLLETHWRDYMQVALSIHTGRISSSVLLRKLGNYSRKNKLYLAAQELGRVERTIYLLRWISDPQLRTDVTGGTNSVEGYHALVKWLQFGGEIIQENDPEEQQKRVRYLAVLASAVIYWNVVEMTRVLNELAQEGYVINKGDIAYVSPYLTRQLKRFGDYGIQTELAPGPIDYTLGLSRRMPVRAVQTRLPFLAEAEAK